MTKVVPILLTNDLNQIASELHTSKWETLEQSASSENLAHFLSTDLNHLLLAYVDNEVAGMLTAHELRKIDPRQCEFLLYEIETKAKFRRQGIGKLLIAKLIEIAKQKGAHEVWVLTDHDNLPANKLYNSAHTKETHSNHVMYVFDILNS